MDTAHDSLTQKLSITKRNRHQYLETAIVSAASADREITLAESRGRERRLREQQRKHTLIRLGWCLLAVVLLGGLATVLLRLPA